MENTAFYLSLYNAPLTTDSRRAGLTCCKQIQTIRYGGKTNMCIIKCLYALLMLSPYWSSLMHGFDYLKFKIDEKKIWNPTWYVEQQHLMSQITQSLVILNLSVFQCKRTWGCEVTYVFNFRTFSGVCYERKIIVSLCLWEVMQILIDRT